MFWTLAFCPRCSPCLEHPSPTCHPQPLFWPSCLPSPSPPVGSIPWPQNLGQGSLLCVPTAARRTHWGHLAHSFTTPCRCICPLYWPVSARSLNLFSAESSAAGTLTGTQCCCSVAQSCPTGQLHRLHSAHSRSLVNIVEWVDHKFVCQYEESRRSVFFYTSMYWKMLSLFLLFFHWLIVNIMCQIWLGQGMLRSGSIYEDASKRG